MNKLTFFFAGLLLIPLILNTANAQEIGEIEKGKDYDIEFMGVIDQGRLNYTWTSMPERIETNANEWVEFIYFEDANVIRVESGRGSYEIDKNTCNFAFYNKGKITGNPTIPSDTYLARQSADGVVYSEVTQVNNAACQTAVIINGDNIEVQTIRTHALGELKVRYIKDAGAPLKTQMEVTNTSGLNDRFFAFYQLIQVPQIIKWGETQIDLATKNNTFYDRTFLAKNQEKVFSLTDKIHYDFLKGYDKLAGVKVIWDGTNAFLQFDFSRNAEILPNGQTYVIDPTLLFLTGYDAIARDDDGNDVCGNVGGAYVKGATGNDIKFDIEGQTGSGNDCRNSVTAFDVSSIPVGSTITGGHFRLNYTVAYGIHNHFPVVKWTLINTTNIHPSLRSAEDLFFDIRDSTLMRTLNPSAVGCCGAIQIPFNTTLAATVNTRFQTGFCCWFGNSILNTTMDLTDKRGYEAGSFEAGDTDMPRLQMVYNLPGSPDAPNDLIAGNTTATRTDLSWSTPSVSGATITGYQINFTTPQGSPDTIITNDTGTTTTNFIVGGLTSQTPYSFRVGIYTATPDSNFTGNIANITTTSFANFTVGSITINATNLDFRTFKFVRTDTSDTTYDLSVIFPNSYNTTCSFHFKFAMTDLNHSNLSTSPTGINEQEAIFSFNNTANEIIDVLCFDENDVSREGRFLLTQNDFLLLQQFEDFRTGTYGTLGMFGAIDLITLVGVIISMIGFNRINESVGAFFMLAILGIMAFFQIIIWPTALTGALAVITMLAITTTRKN